MVRKSPRHKIGLGRVQTWLLILLFFSVATFLISLQDQFKNPASDSYSFSRTSSGASAENLRRQHRADVERIHAPVQLKTNSYTTSNSSSSISKSSSSKSPNGTNSMEAMSSRFRLNVDSWHDVGQGQCHHFEAGPANANEEYPDVLKKQAYSDKTRFVFILGIEGTGHHMFHSVLRECPTCTCPVGINGNADHGGFAVSSYKHDYGVFGSKEGKDGVKKHVNMFTDGLLKSLEEYYKDDEGRFKATDTTTFFINSYKDEGETGRCTLWQDWSSYSEISYPNFGGRCRRWQIPDVRILAEMFESQGVDFRVVVLVRDALDLLISNAVHRKWERWSVIAPQYISILNDNILKSQLLRLDPNFFRCIDYDNLPDIPVELGEFLNIDNQMGSDWTLAKSFKEHFVDKRKDPKANALKTKERLQYSAADTRKYHETLNSATEKLRTLCHL
uniref:Uncharacterized protein n=1 Tax=Aplanochytrium stocchinoi TaxID=215587 RepID=A0A7S3LMY4_9STRA|mmetsp:Transcript_35181/g.43418  ORF Transcript_35181/g.43418 Transcript_35181/m.43418 type:complete len:446 (-) Transcript_35181:170-1507(-)